MFPSAVNLLHQIVNFIVIYGHILLIMKIALASPPIPKSLEDGLNQVHKLIVEAAVLQAELVCFPETYLPGYRGYEYNGAAHDPVLLDSAISQVRDWARENNIAVILPTDMDHERGIANVAHVISSTGELLGHQTKNQLDPSEDELYVPGTERRIFELDGLKFGIVICHEGFRYPELVRWAARKGAQVVFHPHFTGSDLSGRMPEVWGSIENPYYEKAMMMRALENTIYFASVGYATLFPESASAIIAPDGHCIIHEHYGKTGVIVADLDLTLATGLLASRLKPECYES